MKIKLSIEILKEIEIPDDWFEENGLQTSTRQGLELGCEVFMEDIDIQETAKEEIDCSNYCSDWYIEDYGKFAGMEKYDC